MNRGLNLTTNGKIVIMQPYLQDTPDSATGHYTGGSLTYQNLSSITLAGGTAAIFLNPSGGTVSGSNSTAGFAAPSVASGSTDTVTLVVKDTTGAAVTGLSSSAFKLSLG